jgi:hypothetical protein
MWPHKFANVDSPTTPIAIRPRSHHAFISLTPVGFSADHQPAVYFCLLGYCTNRTWDDGSLFTSLDIVDVPNLASTFHVALGMLPFHGTARIESQDSVPWNRLETRLILESGLDRKMYRRALAFDHFLCIPCGVLRTIDGVHHSARVMRRRLLDEFNGLGRNL